MWIKAMTVGLTYGLTQRPCTWVRGMQSAKLLATVSWRYRKRAHLLVKFLHSGIPEHKVTCTVTVCIHWFLTPTPFKIGGDSAQYFTPFLPLSYEYEEMNIRITSQPGTSQVNTRLVFIGYKLLLFACNQFTVRWNNMQCSAYYIHANTSYGFCHGGTCPPVT